MGQFKRDRRPQNKRKWMCLLAVTRPAPLRRPNRRRDPFWWYRRTHRTRPQSVVSFTFVSGGSASTASPTSLSLGSTPAKGSVVGIGVYALSGGTVISVKDANGISYTATPSSPVTSASVTNTVYLYYLIAPSGASSTVIITSTGVGGANASGAVFSVSGGSAAFDKDAFYNGSASSANVNLPSITPTSANSLLFGYMVDLTQVVNSPGAGSTQGIWTGTTGNDGTFAGKNSEYAVSASGSNAISFTLAGAANWMGMAMAFGPASYVPPAREWPPDKTPYLSRM